MDIIGFRIKCSKCKNPVEEYKISVDGNMCLCPDCLITND